MKKNDLDFMGPFMKYINDEATDPFNPESFDEDKIEFLKPTYKSVGKLR